MGFLNTIFGRKRKKNFQCWKCGTSITKELSKSNRNLCLSCSAKLYPQRASKQNQSEMHDQLAEEIASREYIGSTEDGLHVFKKKKSVYCDGHVDIWGGSQMLVKDEGYLLPQHVLFKDDEILSGITARQTATDWLICERCADHYRISGAKRKAARRAAKVWWGNH